MKRGSTIFLRIAVTVLGVAVLAVCVFLLPQAWMAVNTEYPDYSYAVYSVLTAMYAAAVPYFIGSYQALRLLKFIDTNKAFSQLSVQALRVIAYCAGIISLIYVVSLPFFYIWAEGDDAPGLVIIGMFFVGAPLVIAVFAAVLQRLFHEALHMKTENDLTV